MKTQPVIAWHGSCPLGPSSPTISGDLHHRPRKAPKLGDCANDKTWCWGNHIFGDISTSKLSTSFHQLLKNPPEMVARRILQTHFLEGIPATCHEYPMESSMNYLHETPWKTLWVKSQQEAPLYPRIIMYITHYNTITLQYVLVL